MEIGNLQISLKVWEKYGKKRIYLHCRKADGNALPGKGYDGGYFDATGYHSGKGGWIDSARYHNPEQWAKIEKEAKRLLRC